MSDKKVKCAVLGANGYIGRHLCFFAERMGWEIMAYGHSITPHPSLPKNIDYQSIDIRDPQSVDLIEFKVDLIFHFSGLTGTKISFDKSEEFTRVNEIGLLNVLNKVKGSEIKPRIIFPSSRLVYKGSVFPLKEEDEKEAKTVYAANKLNCEQFLRTYQMQFGIDYTIFRICVPYGNYLDNSFSFGTVGFFLNQACSGQSIKLYGDGTLKRTFTNISSLSDQILKASLLEETKNEIYNIAGETLSLLEAAESIASKYHGTIEHVPWPEEDLKLESGDTVFDGAKIENLIQIENQFEFHKWVETI
jgi:UDP-glucose 4-epimerase